MNHPRHAAAAARLAKDGLWKGKDRASARKVEALCTPCAEYALASYDGAREIEPIDERLNRFEREHPHWAKFLGFLPRYLIARWLISYR
jgi:hypothetical protein